MSRKPIIYTSEHPYHVVGRSNNKDWFDLPLNYCYAVFTNVIINTKIRYEFLIHAFVLMDNHYHMILSTPRKNISAGMRYFCTETARGIRVKAERINHVYGGRYKPSLITTAEYYSHCLKYVYRNPVKANLVQSVQDYPWSTISKQHRKLHNEIVPPKTGHDEYIPENMNQLLIWLNDSFSEEEDLQIKRALAKSTFQLSASQKSGKLIQPKLQTGSPHP